MIRRRNAPRRATLVALTVALAATLGQTLVSAGGYETSHAATSDGDGGGGVIVAWEDSRYGERNIYAQRLSPTGVRIWADTGVVICRATGHQIVPGIALDGSGGAIILWRDYRNGNADVYAQRVNGAGVTQWTADGVAVCTDPTASGSAVIAPDAASGALIAWVDVRTGSVDIFAQHLDASGSPLWTSDGIGICTESGTQVNVQIVPDDAGGAVLVWADGRSEYDIFAQRVDGTGSPLWTPGGVPMGLTPLYNDYLVSEAPDGAGGAFVSWYGSRCCPDTMRVFVQHVDGAGAVQWGAGGVAAAPLPDSPHIVSDTAGGAIVFWHNLDRAFTLATSDAQRIDAAGTALWDPVVVLSSVGSDQTTPAVIPDGAGGALAVWEDSRNLATALDLYAQRVHADGSLAWGDGGVPVCTAANYQRNPVMVADGAGGSIAVWEDFRDGGTPPPDSTFYAQRLDGTGASQWLLDGVRVYDTPGVAGVGPGSSTLALAVGPNPATGSITVSFSLASLRPATLELLDLAGRRLAERSLVGLDAGPHVVRLEHGAHTAGIYFARLSQGSDRIVRRVCVLP